MAKECAAFGVLQAACGFGALRWASWLWPAQEGLLHQEAAEPGFTPGMSWLQPVSVSSNPVGTKGEDRGGERPLEAKCSPREGAVEFAVSE